MRLFYMFNRRDDANAEMSVSASQASSNDCTSVTQKFWLKRRDVSRTFHESLCARVYVCLRACVRARLESQMYYKLFYAMFIERSVEGGATLPRNEVVRRIDSRSEFSFHRGTRSIRITYYRN